MHALTRRTLYVSAFALVFAALVERPAFAIDVQEINADNVKDLIELKPFKSLKGAQKIAVPGFRVAFVTRNKVTARSEDWLGGMGGGRSSGSKASMEVMLGNVDYALMQSIANEAYATFLTKMKAAGVEVVSTDALKASETFKSLELAPSSAEAPYTKKMPGGQMHVVVVSPTDLPLWFTNWDAGLTDQGRFKQGNTKAILKLSQELDAAIVYPTFLLDFSALSSSGNSKFKRKASVAATANVYVSPFGTLYWTGNNKGLAFARITDGLGADGAPGKFVTNEEASNAGVVGSLLKMGIEIGPAKSKKDLVLHADPAAYKELAVEVLAGASELYKLAIAEVRK